MIFVLNKCMSCVKQKCHLHQQLSLASFFGIQGAGRNFLDIHRNSRCLQSPNCLYIYFLFLFLFHVSSSSTKLSSVLCATMGVEATVDDSLNTANNVSLSLFFFLMGWKGDLGCFGFWTLPKRFALINYRQMDIQRSRRRSTIGFQLHLQGMQNGGTQLSTMSLPWLVQVS